MGNKEDLKKINIMCVGQSLSDGSGIGGGARFKNMINIFSGLGMKVNIISFSFFSETFKIEKKSDENLNSIFIHIPKRLPKLLKILTIFPVFFYALKYSRNSDIIFSDFITEVAYVPSIVLAKLFGKPIVLDLIDKNFFEITEPLRKFSAKRVDVIFAISNYLQNFAKIEYGCKTVVYIPNFIDTNKFRFDNEIRIIKRNELGFNDGDIVLGYTGSFQNFEGVQVLINAFLNLKKNYPELKLAIMGKAYFDNDEDLLRLIEERPNLEKDIIFIPPQPYEKVHEFLTAFDVLCCSKLDCEINRVANPVKIVEYLSMGLPTVCSAVGGIIDTIDDNLDGFLVEPGDIKSLEKKLEYVILNPEIAKRVGINGRKKAIENFSYNAAEKRVGQSILNLIRTNQ